MSFLVQQPARAGVPRGARLLAAGGRAPGRGAGATATRRRGWRRRSASVAAIRPEVLMLSSVPGPAVAQPLATQLSSSVLVVAAPARRSPRPGASARRPGRAPRRPCPPPSRPSPASAWSAFRICRVPQAGAARAPDPGPPRDQRRGGGGAALLPREGLPGLQQDRLPRAARDLRGAERDARGPLRGERPTSAPTRSRPWPRERDAHAARALPRPRARGDHDLRRVHPAAALALLGGPLGRGEEDEQQQVFGDVAEAVLDAGGDRQQRAGLAAKSWSPMRKRARPSITR